MKSAKTSLTLNLDAGLIRDLRILAAEEGVSISALLAESLERLLAERNAYVRARKRALARLREGCYLQWSRPRSRDELHRR
jgi:hypothetical protein